MNNDSHLSTASRRFLDAVNAANAAAEQETPDLAGYVLELLEESDQERVLRWAVRSESNRLELSEFFAAAENSEASEVRRASILKRCGEYLEVLGRGSSSISKAIVAATMTGLQEVWTKTQPTPQWSFVRSASGSAIVVESRAEETIVDAGVPQAAESESMDLSLQDPAGGHVKVASAEAKNGFVQFSLPGLARPVDRLSPVMLVGEAEEALEYRLPIHGADAVIRLSKGTSVSKGVLRLEAAREGTVDRLIHVSLQVGRHEIPLTTVAPGTLTESPSELNIPLGPEGSCPVVLPGLLVFRV